MPKSEKIAISLPSDLARELDQMRRRTGESRSALVQRAIRAMLRESKERARIARYVDGYLRLPEGVDEIAAAQAAAVRLLAGEPWD